MRLTEKDRQLLALLQLNARESVAAMARQLGVSRSALQERIRKLEESGVIDGYTIRLNQKVTLSRMHCFSFAALDNKSYPGVARQLKSNPAVLAVYAITGDWDIIVHLAGDTLEGLNREINRINEISGIMKTMSHVVMETKIHRALS